MKPCSMTSVHPARCNIPKNLSFSSAFLGWAHPSLTEKVAETLPYTGVALSICQALNCLSITRPYRFCANSPTVRAAPLRVKSRPVERSCRISSSRTFGTIADNTLSTSLVLGGSMRRCSSKWKAAKASAARLWASSSCDIWRK